MKKNGYICILDMEKQLIDREENLDTNMIKAKNLLRLALVRISVIDVIKSSQGKSSKRFHEEMNLFMRQLSYMIGKIDRLST
ncbi:MAG: hypothetical protein ACOYOK_10665 [Pseudobdellovibrionaceae bacterium]